MKITSIQSFFLLLVSIIASTCVIAQNKPIISTDTIVAREARFLQQKLHLSKEQQQKIEVTTKKNFQSKDALSTQKLDTTRRKETLQQLRREHLQALKEILTAAQWKQYEALIEERKAAFRAHAKEKGIQVKELE